MSRHSKNNTAAAHFTYEERQKLYEYGSQEARLGRDSMRPYDACWLCLQTALVDPVVCEEGHLACRQCLLESMLAQKEAIKRRIAEHAEAVARHQAIQTKKAEQEREEEIRKFEAQQRPERVVIMDDQGSRDLASYWIPSKAPDHKEFSKKPPSPPPCKDILCLAVEKSHPVSLKTVHRVHFSKADDDLSRAEPGKSSPLSHHRHHYQKQPQQQHICPQCRRNLSSNNMTLHVIIPCGHVICQRCIDLAAKETKAPLSCDVCMCKADRSIRLYKEGTGFAGGGGKVVVRRDGVAFQ